MKTRHSHRICEHNREFRRCKDCGGKDLCQHHREKRKCKDFGGGSICEHNKVRSVCVDCGGGSICKHSKKKRKEERKKERSFFILTEDITHFSLIIILVMPQFFQFLLECRFLVMRK